MADGIKSNVRIEFKKEVLDKIQKAIAKNTIGKFFETVRNNVAEFIPQDTQTLINSYYIIMSDDGMSGCLGYGSRIENDPINDIAVKQHESVLNHYGMPGRSMREGMLGANIPGTKYAIGGHSLSISSSPTLREQRLHYAIGYREKKAAGQLTKYATKFLEKAVIKAADEVKFDDVLEGSNDVLQ